MQTILIPSLLVIISAAPADDQTEHRAMLAKYMAGLTTLAQAEGPIPLKTNGSNGFAQDISRSQNLVEDGKHKEALDLLSNLLSTNALASDWKSMLETRVAILKKWAASPKIEIRDYRKFFLETGPSWFHTRVRPIATLWKMEALPEVDRYFLMADLLEKRGSLGNSAEQKDALTGAAIVLEAIPHLGGVDSLANGDALQRAGDVRDRLGDKAGAARDWSKVVDEWPRSSEKYAALFRLGSASQKAKAYATSIEQFQSLLDSRPDVAPARAALFAWGYQAHHAAVEASSCYEALGDYPKALELVQQSLTTYPHNNGCGTCSEAEERRLQERINDLRNKSTKR